MSTPANLLIRGRALATDAWQRIVLAEGESAESATLPAGPVIVPLALWQARKAELLARGDVAVWLDANEGPEAIADDLGQLPLVAVNFPKFTDGRGYSTARLLRERYGFRGEIRAIGDVLVDQLHFMSRCGFDAFALRTDQKPETALALFAPFPESYQPGVDEPAPLFRRRAA